MPPPHERLGALPLRAGGVASLRGSCSSFSTLTSRSCRASATTAGAALALAGARDRPRLVLLQPRAQRAPPAVPVSSPSRCAPSIVERLDVGEIRGCTGHQSAPVSLLARYFACAKYCASCRSISRRGVTTRWGLSLLHIRGHSLPGVWSAGVLIGDGTTAADAHRPTASRTLNSAARALAAGTSGTAAK